MPASLRYFKLFYDFTRYSMFSLSCFWIPGQTSAPIQNALLMIWANDEYEHETFMERLHKVGIASKKYPCNIFVASNQEILRWCSLINTIDVLKAQSDSFKFIYPNVPTIGTDLILAEHLTLTHLFSKYVFAEVKAQVPDVRGGTYPVEKLIVFCYEPISVASLDFLYTLIKRLNFQSYPISEIYLFDKQIPTRQITAEFINRINSEIKGDLAQPSKVEMKYLDIYDGLANVPDRIIHFGEA